MDLKRHALEQALRGEDGEYATPPHVPIESIIPHLHDDRDPSRDGGVVIQKEQPWHRQCAYMLLQGMSNKDAAEMFGCTPATIGNLKRQPWFRSICAQLSAIHFDNDVMGLLKNAAVEAVMELSTLATGAKSETVRANAANALLDKFLKHKGSDKPPSDAKTPKEEMAELEKEIERLQQ